MQSKSFETGFSDHHHMIYTILKTTFIKDPVLPMVLCGLTMNFMLYENDFGLAIARLYCRFSLQMNVVMSWLSTRTKDIPENN